MLNALHRRLIGADPLEETKENVDQRSRDTCNNSSQPVGEHNLTVDDFDAITANVRAILSTRFTSMDSTEMERIIQKHKRRRMRSYGLVTEI